MSLPLAGLAFAAGLALVLLSAEKLVAGVVGTSRGFGLSTFAVGVVFLGFDPENLGVGAVASAEGQTGIALGSLIGAAMVAVAFALGVTALVAPIRLERVPKRLLAMPIGAVLLFGALALDGSLSRADGALLLAAYAGAVFVVLRLAREGVTLESHALEEAEEVEDLGPWKAGGLLFLSLAGVVVGGELVVESSRTFLDRWGLDQTFFGMTILAFLVSVEEVARELPAAMKGRPEISLGNVVGSVFAFFLMNAGILALVRPLPVSDRILAFHLPAAIFAIAAVAILAGRGRIGRSAGVALVFLYGGFVAGSALL